MTSSALEVEGWRRRVRKPHGVVMSELGSAAAVGLLSRPYRSLTVGALTLISLVAFEYVAVATAMPTVVRVLDGLALYAVAFGGTMAAGVVSMVVSGGWSDARGPAMPLRVGVAVFAAGLLIAGVAPVMWVLVVGRVVQGLGGGLISVALYVVVGQVLPEALRARFFGLLAGAWLLPSIAGPLLAGLLVERLSWRWVFLGTAALALPALALVGPSLRGLSWPAGRHRPRMLRPLWAVGAAAGALGLHYGGQQTGAVSVVLVCAGLGALVVFAPKLLPTGTFRGRAGLPSVVALRGIAGAAFSTTEVFIPLLLSRERGLSPTAAGFVLTTSAVGWMAGSWVQARLSSQDRIPVVGAGLLAVGSVGVLVTVIPAVPLAVCVAGLAAMALGMGLVYPVLSTLTLRLSPPGEQGMNSSALQLSESLFTTTVLAVTGTLFAAWLVFSPATAYLAGFGVAAALALLAVAAGFRAR
ncbi:MFS transporter [Saccharopolyspora sp. K220]|uniref:MFS transporter n=1 Tax=Saccharopolyspora soli TaxID=2926618 RepID=UPI001F584CEE|nr:MFS transporter [Saccharopolyspora soli]MCI2416558.1 MFS transporter [Saccharopolyspora soli]